MFKFLRDMTTIAEKVAADDGSIDTINMGNYLPGLESIKVTGTTGGKPFKLTLEIGNQDNAGLEMEE